LLAWTLDPNFGTSGQFFVDGTQGSVPDFEGEARAVAKQTVNLVDYIILAGYMKCEPSAIAPICDSNVTGNADWAMIRVRADTFQRDASFGSNGIVTADWDNDKAFDDGLPGRRGLERINSLAIDGQNRIVAVGISYANPGSFTGAKENFIVMRFNEDGSLDTDNFDQGNGATYEGKAFAGFYRRLGTDSCGYWRTNEATDVVIDGQKIVATGWSKRDGDPDVPYFAAARFNSGGSLDTSFGEDTPCDGIPVDVRGTIVIEFGGAGAEANAILKTDSTSSEYILAGKAKLSSGEQDAAVAKLCNNGRLANGTNCASTFGTGGKTNIPFGSSSADVANDMVFWPQTNPTSVFVAGTDGTDFKLARLSLSTGALEAGFASGGLLSYDYNDGSSGSGGGNDTVSSVILHDNDYPLVAGYTMDGSDPDFFSGARFDSDGTPQTPDCGNSCALRSTFGSTIDRSFEMIRQPSGKTLVIGFHTVANEPRMAAIRLCESPTACAPAPEGSSNNPRWIALRQAVSEAERDLGPKAADGFIGMRNGAGPIRIEALESTKPARLFDLPVRVSARKYAFQVTLSLEQFFRGMDFSIPPLSSIPQGDVTGDVASHGF
jgi:uncharacterized delta-60 repeat protein